MRLFQSSLDEIRQLIRSKVIRRSSVHRLFFLRQYMTPFVRFPLFHEATEADMLQFCRKKIKEELVTIIVLFSAQSNFMRIKFFLSLRSSFLKDAIFLRKAIQMKGELHNPQKVHFWMGNFGLMDELSSPPMCLPERRK
jgi:hypothetical protein